MCVDFDLQAALKEHRDMRAELAQYCLTHADDKACSETAPEILHRLLSQLARFVNLAQQASYGPAEIAAGNIEMQPKK